MTIGCFTDYYHPQFLDLKHNGDTSSYYFTEDVSVRQLPDEDTVVPPKPDTLMFIATTLLNGGNTLWHLQNLPAGTRVLLVDELGRIVLDAESRNYDFDFSGLPSACYFYDLIYANGMMKKGKVVYLR